MNLSRFCLAVIVLMGVLQSDPIVPQTGDWQRIVPLHSSRKDVEKLLGSPSEVLTNSVLYRTKDEVVIIFYSNGSPCGTKGSQWRVPRDTVERISVTLNRGLPLSQFNIDEVKYKRKLGGHRSEDLYYVSEEKGEVLRVFNGEILDLNYGPRTSDKDLMCPRSGKRIKLLNPNH